MYIYIRTYIYIHTHTCIIHEYIYIYIYIYTYEACESKLSKQARPNGYGKKGVRGSGRSGDSSVKFAAKGK